MRPKHVKQSLLFLLLSVCVFCLPLSVSVMLSTGVECVCTWCILHALCVPRSLSRYHLFSHVVLDWHPAHWIEYESPWPAVRLSVSSLSVSWPGAPGLPCAASWQCLISRRRRRGLFSPLFGPAMKEPAGIWMHTSFLLCPLTFRTVCVTSSTWHGSFHQEIKDYFFKDLINTKLPQWKGWIGFRGFSDTCKWNLLGMSVSCFTCSVIYSSVHNRVVLWGVKDSFGLSDKISNRSVWCASNCKQHWSFPTCCHHRFSQLFFVDGVHSLHLTWALRVVGNMQLPVEF